MTNADVKKVNSTVKGMSVLVAKMHVAGMKEESSFLLDAAMLLEELALKVQEFGKRQDADTIAKVRKLVASGRTMISVAKEFGIGNSTVQRWCADIDKPRENRGRKSSIRNRGFKDDL